MYVYTVMIGIVEEDQSIALNLLNLYNNSYFSMVQTHVGTIHGNCRILNGGLKLASDKELTLFIVYNGYNQKLFIGEKDNY